MSLSFYVAFVSLEISIHYYYSYSRFIDLLTSIIDQDQVLQGIVMNICKLTIKKCCQLEFSNTVNTDMHKGSLYVLLLFQGWLVQLACLCNVQMRSDCRKSTGHHTSSEFVVFAYVFDTFSFGLFFSFLNF